MAAINTAFNMLIEVASLITVFVLGYIIGASGAMIKGTGVDYIKTFIIKYGDHTDDCNYWIALNAADCSCGFCHVLQSLNHNTLKGSE